MAKRDSVIPINLRVHGLAAVLMLLGSQPVHPSHGTPTPPPPPGHGQVIIRLALGLEGGEAAPEGQIGVQGLALRRAGAAGEGNWVPLPLIWSQFSTRELSLGVIWIADAPVPAGEFDRIRLDAGGKSDAPLGLRLAMGQHAVLILKVGVQVGARQGPLRLTLKGAQILAPS